MQKRPLLFLLLLLSSIIFSATTVWAVDTNSILAIGAAPSGDAVDGSWTETVTTDGNYTPCEIGDAVGLTQEYLLAPSGVYSASEIGDGSVSLITNSILAIGTTPDGDAVNGAWTETLTTDGGYSSSIIAIITMASQTVEPSGCATYGKVGHLGEVKWIGITWVNVDWNNMLKEIQSNGENATAQMIGF